MNIKRFALLFCLLFVALASSQGCDKKRKGQLGRFVLVKGKVQIEHEGKAARAKLQDPVSETDTIFTGANSLAVVELGGIKIEIQKNARLELKKAIGKEREIFLGQGNAWFQVNKLPNGEQLKVRTPVAVAGVRGTKFFSFKFADIEGVCHCEGEVEFANRKSRYFASHKKDEVVFIRDGKTAMVTAEEMEKLGLPVYENHRHSQVDDSPVGEREVPYTAEEGAKLMKLLEGKFKKAQL